MSQNTHMQHDMITYWLIYVIHVIININASLQRSSAESQSNKDEESSPIAPNATVQYSVIERLEFLCFNCKWTCEDKSQGIFCSRTTCTWIKAMEITIYPTWWCRYPDPLPSQPGLGHNCCSRDPTDLTQSPTQWVSQEKKQNSGAGISFFFWFTRQQLH